MNRTLIAAALLGALATSGAVNAQGYDRYQRDQQPDVRGDWGNPQMPLGQLRAELDRLGDDPAVQRRAAPELDRADQMISELEDAQVPPAPLALRQAESLLRDVERAAGQSPRRGGDYGVQEREVVVVERDDPNARRDVDRARFHADRARREADAQREAAMAARAEAEQERLQNEALREELAGLQMRETERGLVVTLGDVLFETGKAEIKPGARRSLDQMVRALRDDPDAMLTIEGHTDSVGKRNYNVSLSNRRAQVVRSYLVARGVSSRRIDARGMGPDFPVASNKTEAGRQQNRRVEMIVQADD